MIRETCYRIYVAGMSSFLAYALANFLYEIILAKAEFDSMWVFLSFEQQRLANFQLFGQDLLIMGTIFCIIIFVNGVIKNYKR